jgi:hypothetical protein
MASLKCDIFSAKSIKDLQKALKEYAESLEDKCQRFCEELSEIGIKTAEQNNGQFSRYIVFSKSVEPTKYGCKAIITATETGTITSKWKTKDGVKSAEVSPLLMAEFGSGSKARNPLGTSVGGVVMGQGTFPNQTHAFNKDGWYWVDLDDKLHHSYGIVPSMPMYNAYVEMQNQISAKKREIFGK